MGISETTEKSVAEIVKVSYTCSDGEVVTGYSSGLDGADFKHSAADAKLVAEKHERFLRLDGIFGGKKIYHARSIYDKVPPGCVILNMTYSKMFLVRPGVYEGVVGSKEDAMALDNSLFVLGDLVKALEKRGCAYPVGIRVEIVTSEYLGDPTPSVEVYANGEYLGLDVYES